LGNLIDLLREEVENANRVLEEKDSVRERAIKMSRDIIKASRDVVTYVHSGEITKAREALERLRTFVDEFQKLLEPHPELKYSGFANNALTEYVEACMFFAFVIEKRVPRCSELGVHYVPYLLGMCDFVGELRRYVVDLLRIGNFEKAFEVVTFMESVYEVLRTLDYPDALLPGFRHKIDVMRRLVEDTKLFVMDMESRKRLSDAISNAMRVLSR